MDYETQALQAIEYIEQLLREYKHNLGKSYKTDPVVLKLEKIVEAIKNQELEDTLNEAAILIKSLPKSRPKKNGSFALKDIVSDAYNEWVLRSREAFIDPNGPYIRYKNQDENQTRLNLYQEIISKEPKEWLIEELSQACLTIEQLIQRNASLEKEVRFLANQFHDKYQGRIKAVTSQRKNKEKRFKRATDSKKAGLDRLIKDLRRAAIGEDFSEYVAIMNHFFPNPDFLEQTESDRSEWPRSSLRKFFETETGLKAKFSAKAFSQSIYSTLK